MLPPFFSKPLSALLLFLFLFIPQSFARDNRDNENYMDKFISLLSGEIETSSSNKKVSKSSKKQHKNSPPSASKQKQNRQKQERLFKKSAQEAEKLINKYQIDLNQKVPIEGRDTFPAIAVAKSGNVLMMEVLIKHGINLDLKDGKINVNYETHPSHSAILNAEAKSGHTPMVELLLKHIPDTDNQRVGSTNIAARKGDLNMLRFLKEQGVPFHSGCLAAVSHQCNISAGCRSKQETDCSHLTVMRYLLENGFDIKRDRGEALAWACSRGNETMVRFLLEHGAECHIHSAAICSASGSAIVKAGEGGNVNVIKMLLAKGANIHDIRQDGKANALHQATQYGQAAIVPFLVQQGIEVNTPNGYGETPLILAAKFGWLDTVKVLLAQGADASVRDHKGKTAADHALESSNHTKSTLDGYYFDKKGAGEVYRLLSKSR